MNDVAKLAGVSQSTVSFVFNNAPIAISDDVKQRVYDAAEALGFKHKSKAKNFSKSDSKIIALLIPNMSNYFYAELAKNTGFFALEKGYRLIVLNTNRNAADEQNYLSVLCSGKNNISGIIYGFTPSIADFTKFITDNIPIVVIGEMQEYQNISLVTLDSFKSGAMVANHLLNLNHKDFVFITSPPNAISLSRERRLEGIQSAVEGKGSITVLCGKNEAEFDTQSYEVEIGYQLTKEYFAQKKATATAFIGANDMIAFGIIKAMNEMQISIPGQVSICGFDNILFSSITNPSLTTVDHATYWRCGMAVDILDNKIQKKFQAPSAIHYDPFLIVRSSSGPASV
jgi:LacI family transcriptional regulator